MTHSASTRPVITVSIINYRTAQLTIQCLISVLAEITRCPHITTHVVVVDNDSKDGSADEIDAWLLENDPDKCVTMVRSPENSGFSGGHNLGMSTREADFYLVLNSDAEVQPGLFEAITAAAADAPKMGIFAPKLTWEDGRVQTSCFRFPGPKSEFIRGANTGYVSRLLAPWSLSLSMPPKADDIQWVSFACVLIRHEMLAQIGPMDEGYFLYFEDSEYCLRARRAGWGTCYAQEGSVIHHRGGSGPVKSLASQYKRMPPYYYASRTRFLYQAHGRFGLWATNLAWLTGRGLAQLRRLAGKKVNPLAEKETHDLWTNITKPLGPSYGPERQGSQSI